MMLKGEEGSTQIEINLSYRVFEVQLVPRG
jgi:hypothetical protein